MNPFEKINQMKDILKEESKSVNASDTISYFEHYQKMLNMLTILSEELKNAEYNYVIEDMDTDNVQTFNEMKFNISKLTESLLIMQPASQDLEQLGAIDVSSLLNVLKSLKESDKIKEDIIFIPPFINVLKAKLALPEQPEDNDENVT